MNTYVVAETNDNNSRLNILGIGCRSSNNNNNPDLLHITSQENTEEPEQSMFSEMLIWLFVQQKDFGISFSSGKKH